MTSKDKYYFNIIAHLSLGEVVDKITILEIKQVKMNGKALENVEKELTSLRKIIQSNKLEIDIHLINNLRKVNKNLWEIEDNIREKERKQEFDNEFIQLARSVYKENDKRAYIKKEINYEYNSDFVEEKSYKSY